MTLQDTAAHLRKALLARVQARDMGFVRAGRILQEGINWRNTYLAQEVWEEFTHAETTDTPTSTRLDVTTTWTARAIALFSESLALHGSRSTHSISGALQDLYDLRNFLWQGTHRRVDASPETAAQQLLTKLSMATPEEIVLVRKELDGLGESRDDWRLRVTRLLREGLTDSFVATGKPGHGSLWENARKEGEFPFRYRPLHGLDVPYGKLLPRLCYGVAMGTLTYADAWGIWKECVQEWRVGPGSKAFERTFARPGIPPEPDENVTRKSTDFARVWMRMAYDTEGLIYPFEFKQWVDDDIIDQATREWIQFSANVPEHTHGIEPGMVMESSQSPNVLVPTELQVKALITTTQMVLEGTFTLEEGAANWRNPMLQRKPGPEGTFTYEFVQTWFQLLKVISKQENRAVLSIGLINYVGADKYEQGFKEAGGIVMGDTVKEATPEATSADKTAEPTGTTRKYDRDLLHAQLTLALSVIQGKRSRKDAALDLKAAIRRNNLADYGRPYPNVRVNQDVVTEWCHLVFLDEDGKQSQEVNPDSLAPVYHIADGRPVDAGLRNFLKDTKITPHFRVQNALERDSLHLYGGNLEYLATRNNSALEPYERNDEKICEFAAALVKKAVAGNFTVKDAASWWVHRKVPYCYHDHVPSGVVALDKVAFSPEVADVWDQVVAAVKAEFGDYDSNLLDHFKYHWVPMENIRKAREIEAKREAEALKVGLKVPDSLGIDLADNDRIVSLMFRLDREELTLEQAAIEWSQRATLGPPDKTHVGAIQFPQAERAYELLLKVNERREDTVFLSAAIRRVLPQAIKDEMNRDYGRVLGKDTFTLETLEKFRWTQESLALRAAWNYHRGDATLDQAVEWWQVGLNLSTYVPDRSLAPIEMDLPFATSVATLLRRLRKEGLITRWLNRAAGRFDVATIAEAIRKTDQEDYATQWAELNPAQLEAQNGFVVADLIRRMKSWGLTTRQAANQWLNRKKEAFAPYTPMMAATEEFGTPEDARITARWWKELEILGQTEAAREAEKASTQWLTIANMDAAKVKVAAEMEQDAWERNHQELFETHETDLLRSLLWNGAHNGMDEAKVANTWKYRFADSPPVCDTGMITLTPEMVEFGFLTALYDKTLEGVDDSWVAALKRLIQNEGLGIEKTLARNYGEKLSVETLDYRRFKLIQNVRSNNALRMAFLVHLGRWTKKEALEWWKTDHGKTLIPCSEVIPNSEELRSTCLELAQVFSDAGVSDLWLLKAWATLAHNFTQQTVTLDTQPKKTLGQVVVDTVRDDAKEIALRTGVKRIRAIAGDRLSAWWVRASNPRAAGETQDAWEERCRRAAGNSKAFLTSEMGQGLMAMVLGFTWSAAAGSIESEQVRAFGDVVAKELRIAGGTDLLDGVLEEVIHPVLSQLPAEATNLRVLITSGVAGAEEPDNGSIQAPVTAKAQG